MVHVVPQQGWLLPPHARHLLSAGLQTVPLSLQTSPLPPPVGLPLQQACPLPPQPPQEWEPLHEPPPQVVPVPTQTVPLQQPLQL